MLLSLVCIFFDRHTSSFHQWREQAEVVVTPLRYLVSKPIEWTHQLIQGLTLQKHLVEENNQLRIHEIMLQSEVQRLLAIQRENEQLKALLQSAGDLTGRVKVGHILAISLDPGLHQLVLNKGKVDDVYIGQPVFDAYGVMGQIVDTARNTSKLLLVTDPRSAIPVQDYRNGMRAVLAGTGDTQTLKLLNVSTLADIQKGDIFVTSGYGQLFPQGYPVGVVINVTHKVGQKFLAVSLLPSAHLDQTQRVLLVWPSQLKLRNQVEQLLKRSLPQPGTKA